MKKLNLLDVLNHRWEYQGPREICGAGFSTAPPLPAGISALPAILYNQTMAAVTATISTTTLMTAPANGTYLIACQGTTTVLGSGASSSLGYHTVTAGFTDPVGSAQTFQIGVITLGTGSNYNGVLGNCPYTTGPGFAIVRCKAGSAITIATVLTAAGGSPAPNPNMALTTIIMALGT